MPKTPKQGNARPRRPQKRETHAKRILVVDDHPIIACGLQQLVAQDEGLSICGTAATIGDALAALKKLRPHLLLVDVSMNGESGLELVRQVRDQDSRMPILMLSVHDEHVYAERALRTGAQGYVMKHEPPGVLLEAIHKVLKGGTYVSEKASSRILAELWGRPKTVGGKSGAACLSDRELQVLELIGSGRATREVAEALGVSVKTVETHRRHIKRKLDVHTTTELLSYAIHWVSLPSSDDAR